MASSEDGENKRNGRPAYSPSDAERELVTAMSAEGADDQAIADRLEISMPTLRKYFAAEMAEGRSAAAPSLFEASPAGQPAPSVAAPALPPKRRGRPSFKATNRDRELVRVLAAGGISLDVIARRIGISVPTLTRVFRDDLSSARETTRAQIIEQLHKQMMGGSTTAAEKLRNMMDEADLAVLRAAAPIATKVETKPQRETLGKKVQQARSAQDEAASGKWSKNVRLASLQ